MLSQSMYYSTYIVPSYIQFTRSSCSTLSTCTRKSCHSEKLNVAPSFMYEVVVLWLSLFLLSLKPSHRVTCLCCDSHSSEFLSLDNLYYFTTSLESTTLLALNKEHLSSLSFPTSAAFTTFIRY